MAQSSPAPQTPRASPPPVPVIEDPASGTVDVEAGEKVSTVEAGAVAATTRLDAVDLLRGLVMVIMALDHARFFFHEAARSRVSSSRSGASRSSSTCCTSR